MLFYVYTSVSGQLVSICNIVRCELLSASGELIIFHPGLHRWPQTDDQKKNQKFKFLNPESAFLEGDYYSVLLFPVLLSSFSLLLLFAAELC